MVVPSQGLQSKSLHKWARLPRSQSRSIPQLWVGSYESPEFPIVCSALAFAKVCGLTKHKKIAGKIRPGGGGKGFFLLYWNCHVFSKSSSGIHHLSPRIPGFYRHPDASGLTRSFRASRWSSGSSICPAAFHKRQSSPSLQEWPNDKQNSESNVECLPLTIAQMWQAKHPSSVLRFSTLGRFLLSKKLASQLSQQLLHKLSSVWVIWRSMEQSLANVHVDRRESPNVQYHRIQKADVEDIFKKDQERVHQIRMLRNSILPDI